VRVKLRPRVVAPRVLDVVERVSESLHCALREVEHAGGGLERQPDQPLAGSLDQPTKALRLRTLYGLREETRHALHLINNNIFMYVYIYIHIYIYIYICISEALRLRALDGL